MSNETITLSPALYEYMLQVSLREPAVLRALRQETARDPMARMQVAPEQGQFLALLARLSGAREALEIGVYTGYSALWVAQALPDDGRLVACDISEAWTAVGQPYWRQAGVAHKIDLRIAPAAETLQALLAGGAAGSFDMAFIDADKEGYIQYYESCLELLRPGGIVAVDNVLWHGRVVESGDDDADTAAIRRFNAHAAADERVDLSLVPIGDGLTLAVKRS